MSFHELHASIIANTIFDTEYSAIAVDYTPKDATGAETITAIFYQQMKKHSELSNQGKTEQTWTLFVQETDLTPAIGDYLTLSGESEIYTVADIVGNDRGVIECNCIRDESRTYRPQRVVRPYRS